MEIIKLPKKFRMVCYDIMDGKDEALNVLETFSEQFPHQVAAVKAEVAYFNMDYNRALDLDLTILPYLEEWYYSNVSDQHMIAMAITSLVLHREEEVLNAFRREQERIRAENGWQQRDRYCDILMNYIRQGQMPFADDTKNHPYNEPEEAKSKEQLWKEIQENNKKLTLDSVDGKRRLYNFCCMFGHAKDAVELFEELSGAPMAESSYTDAIARYLYLGERDKAIQTAEKLATSRLWAVAGPTQVRPMTFFEDLNLRDFIMEESTLRKIREAAYIDDGSQIRK